MGILLASVTGSVAQEILPVQEGPEYELLRRRQLHGDTTDGLQNFSMMVRPFSLRIQ